MISLQNRASDEAAAPGHADVVGVRVCRNSDGSYCFNVTIRSRDNGWDSFADAFEILSPDETVISRRILAHPHETEQPFTRELDGVAIPNGVDTVTVRAHHKEHGFSGATMAVKLSSQAS